MRKQECIPRDATWYIPLGASGNGEAMINSFTLQMFAEQVPLLGNWGLCWDRMIQILRICSHPQSSLSTGERHTGRWMPPVQYGKSCNRGQCRTQGRKDILEKRQMSCMSEGCWCRGGHQHSPCAKSVPGNLLCRRGRRLREDPWLACHGGCQALTLCCAIRHS